MQQSSDSMATAHTAALRLVLGLAQGLALYGLYRAAKDQSWPANEVLLFAPLLLAACFVPVLLMSGLGHLPATTLWRWALAAALITLGLGLHDSWRSVGAPAWEFGRDTGPTRLPSPLLWFFGAAGFFIAHAMVLAGGAEGRRIASYPAYFDSAWKLLIQLPYSALFVGAFWAILALGAALFKLIELSFLFDLLKEPWFAIPVTAMAFACAMHLTDVRPAIVRGLRNLLLVLLSWILPLTLLLIGGFLCSLPFTGLQHLWATKHATALLLGAAAALVVLINTAYQNGAVAAEVAGLLRVSARLASLALAPLVLIALYALALRVGEHGWTTDRIIAANCVLVACCYAVGYAWAALRGGLWLDGVARVNIATSFLILALLLALFSPLLDPARLSVANQLARLEGGTVSAQEFDVDYLWFEGKRYGAAALERLKLGAGGKDAALLRERATQAMERKNRWDNRAQSRPSAQQLDANLKVWPQPQPLPDSFKAQDWSAHAEPWLLPECLRSRTAKCDVFLVDLDGSGPTALLVVGEGPTPGRPTLFAQGADSRWRATATLAQGHAQCEPLRDRLRAGDFRLLAPRLKDLEVAGQRIALSPIDDPHSTCESLEKLAKP